MNLYTMGLALQHCQMSTQHVWFWSAHYCSQQVLAGKNWRLGCAAAWTARYTQIPGIRTLCMLRYFLHFTYGIVEVFQTCQTTLLKPMNNRRYMSTLKKMKKMKKSRWGQYPWDLSKSSGCIYSVYCINTWISISSPFLNNFFPGLLGFDRIVIF